MTALEDKEDQALKFIASELGRHLAHNNRTIALINDVQALWDEAAVAHALAVGMSLLARTFDDLRSIRHLTLRGYGVPACTVGASIFEAAHSVGYVGQDNERAWNWLNLGKPEFTFPTVEKRIRGSLLNAGIPIDEIKEMASRAREDYRLLCMVKHPSNRNLQLRQHGVEDNVRIGARYGPDLTRAGVHTCAFALRVSANWAKYAVSIVLQHPCDSPDAHALAIEAGDHSEGIALGEWELDCYGDGEADDVMG